MDRFGRTVARGAAALAIVTGGLSAFAPTFMTPAASAAASCTVTVMTTDANGQVDGDVKPFDAPCRAGESNGDIELYNPYTDTYSVIHNVPLEPLSPTHTSTPGSSSGSAVTSSATTPSCTPAVGGTKLHTPTVQRPGQVACPSPSSAPRPSR